MALKRRLPEAPEALERRALREEVEHYVKFGLGVRSTRWWQAHCPRLAIGYAEDDIYAHLAGPDSPRMVQARARLTHLVDEDELTAGEKLAIVQGDGPRYQWRRRILGVTRVGRS